MGGRPRGPSSVLGSREDKGRRQFPAGRGHGGSEGEVGGANKGQPPALCRLRAHVKSGDP